MDTAGIYILRFKKNIHKGETPNFGAQYLRGIQTYEVRKEPARKKIRLFRMQTSKYIYERYHFLQET